MFIVVIEAYIALSRHAMALYLNSYVMAMIYTSLPSLEGSTVQTTLAVYGSLVLSFGQMQYGLQPVCLKASVALSFCCCCAVIGLVSTISSNGVKHKKPRTRQQDTGNQATLSEATQQINLE